MPQNIPKLVQLHKIKLRKVKLIFLQGKEKKNPNRIFIIKRYLLIPRTTSLIIKIGLIIDFLSYLLLFDEFFFHPSKQKIHQIKFWTKTKFSKTKGMKMRNSILKTKKKKKKKQDSNNKKKLNVKFNSSFSISFN